MHPRFLYVLRVVLCTGQPLSCLSLSCVFIVGRVFISLPCSCCLKVNLCLVCSLFMVSRVFPLFPCSSCIGRPLSSLSLNFLFSSDLCCQRCASLRSLLLRYVVAFLTPSLSKAAEYFRLVSAPFHGFLDLFFCGLFVFFAVHGFSFPSLLHALVSSCFHALF